MPLASGGRRRAASTASPERLDEQGRVCALRRVAAETNPRSARLPGPKGGNRTAHAAAATAAAVQQPRPPPPGQRDYLRAGVEDAQPQRPAAARAARLRTPARPRRSGAPRARPRSSGSPPDGARTLRPLRGRERRGRTRLPPRAPRLRDLGDGVHGHREARGEDDEGAHGGEEADEPPSKSTPAKARLASDRHEADARDAEGEPRAERQDQDEAEGDPVERDRRQQDDEGRRAGKEPARDADRRGASGSSARSSAPVPCAGACRGDDGDGGRVRGHAQSPVPPAGPADRAPTPTTSRPETRFSQG